MNRVLVVSFIALLVPMGRGEAQVAVHSGWPNVNQSLVVAPGEQVVLLNRILVDRGPGLQPVRRMDFEIRSDIPPASAAEREAQALRVARTLAPEASNAGVRLMAIAFCDSDACAGRREPPKVWFLFQPGPGGVWQRTRD